MTDIAVLVIHPNGSHSAQLLETSDSVAEAVAKLVPALELPSTIQFELLSANNENGLPEDSTLEICGVRGGSELRLRPIRDRALKEVLDQYYADAERLVRARKWTAGKEKLAELLAFDPTYPDPLGLEKAIDQQVLPTQTAPRAVAQPARRPLPTMAVQGDSKKVIQIRSKLIPEKSGKYRLLQKGTAKKALPIGRLGCLLAALLLFALAFVGGMLLNSPDLWPNITQALGIQLPVPETRSLGTGDIQVTLRWSGTADLDLRVTEPNGDQVRFDTPRTASGGTLDIVANEDCMQPVQSPVENIYWGDGAAQTGLYTVTVVYFQVCNGSDITDYEITVTQNRDAMDVITGQIAPRGGAIIATEFEYGRP